MLKAGQGDPHVSPHGRESLKVIKGAISGVANLFNSEGSLARSEPEDDTHTLPRKVLGESWAALRTFVGCPASPASLVSLGGRVDDCSLLYSEDPGGT